MSFRSIFIIVFFSFFLAPSAHSDAQGSVEQETEQLDFAQGLLSRGMYDMAILQYQKFIADYPHSASLQEAYLSLGEGYFLSGDFKKAVDAFNQFKGLYPHSEQLPVVLLRLGQIDIQQEKYDEALKELTSIDAQKQLKGAMLQSFDFYTAQAYAGKTDTADALAFFQKAAQVQQAAAYTAYAFEEIGKIYAQRGQYTKALDEYEKSMPLAEENSLKGELTYRIAEIRFLSGQYADAVKGFKQALDQYPSLSFTQDAYFAIHFETALSLIELKEYDQANALLDRVIGFPSLKPQERAKIFIKKADILIREGKYKDGLALLDADASENSNEADETSFLKAQGYFGLGDFDRAFKSFENVTLNFPKSRFSMAALLGQAHALQKTGRFKESEALFLKYVNTQDDPDLKSEALWDAVMVAVKAGDVSGVISSAREYLKAPPKGEQYSEVLLTLADYEDKNNQPQEAVDLLTGYLAKNPSPQRPNAFYFLLGLSQQLLGNSDQALAAYTQVDQHKEKGEFYFDALKNMAIIYLSQKKNDQAKVYFDRLISQTDQNALQVNTYVWVCNEYLKERKFDDVLRIAAQAEKYFSAQDLQQIKYFKAEALRGLGRCDEALKSYDFVTSSPQKNAYTGSAHIGHGLCLESAKKFDAAGQEFQKALDENSDDYTITAHARFEMANLEASQGHFDDALKFYLLVAAIYDDEYFCSESLLRAAKIDEHLQRKEDALKLYAEILDKYKNSAAAREAKARLQHLK